MELRQLRYFLALAQELHFGRAAEKVHIAQSPLSRQIKQLEDSLGVMLFRRTRHHVELTPAGRAFIPQARAVLAATDLARSAARQADAGMSGRISIGYTNSAIYTSFPEILVRYRRTYPQVQVQLFDSMLTPMQLDALVDRQLDLGHSVIETLVIASQRLMVALPAGHAMACCDEIDLAQLAGQPFVMFSRGLDSALATTMMRVCHDAGFHPDIVQEVGDIPTMITLVAHGLGVALVPSSASHMEIKGAVFRSIKGGGPVLEMAMAWNRNIESAQRDRFVEMARLVLTEKDHVGESALPAGAC